jgi:hypothetical protein
MTTRSASESTSIEAAAIASIDGAARSAPTSSQGPSFDQARARRAKSSAPPRFASHATVVAQSGAVAEPGRLLRGERGAIVFREDPIARASHEGA